MSITEISNRIIELETEVNMLRAMRRRLEEHQADIMTHLAAACLTKGVSVAQAQSSSRLREVCDARAIFAYNAYRSGYSRQAIAAALNKDRSSTYEMITRAEWHCKDNLNTFL